MKKNVLCGFAALVLIVAPAWAQQAKNPPGRTAPVTAQQPAVVPPAAAVQGGTPQQTTATYGDWILQCVQPAGQPESCDMAQVTEVQGKGAPFSRVAVSKPERAQPVRLVVQVPVNVSFGTAVKIQTSDEDPGLTASFATCTPNGCYSLFDVKEEEMKKLRAASSHGALSFADSSGRPVKIPLSFNGFNQAFEALTKK